jgi:hypothetical protein
MLKQTKEAVGCEDLFDALVGSVASANIARRVTERALDKIQSNVGKDVSIVTAQSNKLGRLKSALALAPFVASGIRARRLTPVHLSKMTAFINLVASTAPEDSEQEQLVSNLRGELEMLKTLQAL